MFIIEYIYSKEKNRIVGMKALRCDRRVCLVDVSLGTAYDNPKSFQPKKREKTSLKRKIKFTSFFYQIKLIANICCFLPCFNWKILLNFWTFGLKFKSG